MSATTITELKKQKEEKLSEIFKKNGVFFAFSNEQFAQNKTPLKEGEKYVSMGAGGYLPKGNASSYMEDFKNLQKWYKDEVRNNKLRIELIKYELDNHEAGYTGSIDETLDALGPEYTREEVRKVYSEYY